ncbi:MAG: pyridoxamine 5'-phosphate oxidase [Gemmatimonadetes bacterium]|nr:pyridoxamine 5'-phosphate oxidase [Gemmatimonadota bacterium]MBT8404350.1 pyridoxamine 5'-phosphate oxidase [Gemmatimonadota bacterium]NNF37717.1 pyridoxamine 5'-phosphate oxidase [Gemmatimonadota bacterium]
MSLTSRIRALKTFGKGVALGLPDPTGDEDPIELFQQWYDDAERAGLFLPEAMCLATATPDGIPSSRMVLLKGIGPAGFVFFTNYESRKAGELDANPNASLLFHWAILERQVRVEGTVERISEEQSYAYYSSRGRGSRIGAWASRQSRPLEARDELRRRVREFEERFPGDDVPLPPYWGGYRIVPHRIEFWQGRADRLHDRWEWRRDGDGWTVVRLYP